ncbi:MAG TPA: glycerophosphodiester phosphodiesterase family protein [Candidatus Hydrogenedentes bacterium]|nr:glycerophosphodiester phosphodiesterase family protein [Candidatus Hydrogenedentota bacterium]
MTLVALFAVLAALGGSSGPPGACAHRGDVRFFPENTLPAFTSAVAKGAHMIEFDVYLTSDGVPIIIHDNTLDRTTNGTGNVTAYSLEELRTLDAGAWFDPKFAGTRIPTLQETLAVIPRYILCNVHLKSAPGLAAATTAVIAGEERLDQCVLACSIEQAAEARSVAPEIRICNMSERRRSLAEYVDATHRTNAAFLQVHHRTADGLAEQLARAREWGITANYFYADTPDDIRRVADAGAHYILTNDLDTCLAVLRNEFGVRPARHPVKAPATRKSTAPPSR